MGLAVEGYFSDARTGASAEKMSDAPTTTNGSQKAGLLVFNCELIRKEIRICLES